MQTSTSTGLLPPVAKETQRYRYIQSGYTIADSVDEQLAVSCFKLTAAAFPPGFPSRNDES